MNEHLLHFLFIFVPLFTALILSIKSARLKLSVFRVLAVIVLVCFIALHISPDRLLHANGPAGHNDSLYPCCVMQISDVPETAVVLPSVVYSVALDSTLKQHSKRIVLFSINSRAPPSFL